MIRIGVIGYGYWGPNIVRNLRSLEGCQLAAVCDQSPAALQRVRQAYPDLAVTRKPYDLLTSPEIDAVAVVTPVSTHFDLAKVALENGKHVFVEKPFTSTTQQAEELIELADRKNLRIMVDHTFLFTGAVRKSDSSSKRASSAISITTIRRGSTWGSFSTTSASSGTWRRMISPSWTSSSRRSRKP